MKRQTVLAVAFVMGIAPYAFAQNAIELDGMQLDAPATDIADPNSAAFVPPPKPPAAKVVKITPATDNEPQAREIPTIENDAQVRSQADVSYATGGIGEDEKQAIEAAKGDYNLYVMSAATSGAFVGEARVTITRKAGTGPEEMLSVNAGPLLYVKLPAGSYTLEATLGEQVKKQNFTVAKGKPARVHLGWKVPATLAQ